MAHFAEIGLNNTVLRVIVINNNELLDDNNIEQEYKGRDFCRRLFGGTWIQTSYNSSFRKHYAGVGYTYDSARDAFIPPKPYDSWALDETSCTWKAPVQRPNNENTYTWDEESRQWMIVE